MIVISRGNKKESYFLKDKDEEMIEKICARLEALNDREMLERD